MYVLCCTLNPLSNVAFSESTLKVILIGNSAEVLTVGSYKSKNIFDGKKLQVKLNIESITHLLGNLKQSNTKSNIMAEILNQYVLNCDSALKILSFLQI